MGPFPVCEGVNPCRRMAVRSNVRIPLRACFFGRNVGSPPNGWCLGSEDTMKRVMMISLCMALGGCASFGNPPSVVDIVDSQKVVLVEQWARRNSVQVIWMNVPTRSVAADSQEAIAAGRKS